MPPAIDDRFDALVAEIRPVDRSVDDEFWSRLDSLTKPPRSLGRLEELAVQIAAIQGTFEPAVSRKAVLLAAGDHGVAAEGVSPYPQEVTAQMVANFAGGGAAINQIASVTGATIEVLDVGVASPVDETSILTSAKVMSGTRNMLRGPAMERSECLEALLAGADAVSRVVDQGVDLIATGEMGIANTTSAAALVAVYAEAPVADVVGPGTGLDEEGVRHKAEVIEASLHINEARALDPIGVLACVGGLEIAALAGVYLECARRRLPVVIDGFISSAAALAAVRACPASAGVQIASHLSSEPGHAIALRALGARPVLELEMRLGEGSGAALCLPIIDAACRVMSGMSTFAEAGVADSVGTES